MTTIINGTSSAITFPDATVQNSAGLAAGGTIASGTITSGTVTTLASTTATITTLTAPTSTITTLNAPSGVLATQNGMTGICKAWINYNGATQTILGSFNVSSVTYTSTGVYVVNFTTAMPNANYCPVTNSTRDTTNPLYYVAHAYNLSTTQCRIYNGFADSYSGAVPGDSIQVNLAVFST